MGDGAASGGRKEGCGHRGQHGARNTQEVGGEKKRGGWLGLASSLFVKLSPVLGRSWAAVTSPKFEGSRSC